MRSTLSLFWYFLCVVMSPLEQTLYPHPYPHMHEEGDTPHLYHRHEKSAEECSSWCTRKPREIKSHNIPDDDDEYRHRDQVDHILQILSGGEHVRQYHKERVHEQCRDPPARSIGAQEEVESICHRSTAKDRRDTDEYAAKSILFVVHDTPELDPSIFKLRQDAKGLDRMTQQQRYEEVAELMDERTYEVPE